MVNDQHRHAQLLGQRNFCICRDAGIYRNHVAGARLVHFFDGRRRKAVAIAKTVRESPIGLDTKFGQCACHKRYSGHAVQIVIAKDKNLFVLFADI